MKKQINETIMSDYGKIPPQNISAEIAVLGALLIEPKSILKVSDLLTPDVFYLEPHRIIYGAILDLFLANTPIDLISVLTYLTKKGKSDEVGGAFALSELTKNIASASHIEAHSGELLEHSIKRKIITLTSQINAKAFEPHISTDELITESLSIIENAINITGKKSKIESFEHNLGLAISIIQDKQKFDDKKAKVRPILKSLRDKIPEWNTGEVAIIAGRPGMAKTSFALFEIYEQAKKGHASAFFSLEMQTDRLVMKPIQAETGLTMYDFERVLNPSEWEKIDNVHACYKNLPIFIDDTPLATFAHIKTKSKLLKDRHNIRFIAIDYLQLMGGERNGNSTKEEFISTISRNLKALSKELDVTIFLLSQLNRDVEKRNDKRPQLADLRDSGAIEQDSDIVLFPFRPEYYWPNDDDLRGEGIIIVAKNRNGAPGDVHMKYNQSVTRFMDIDDTYETIQVYRDSEF